MTEVHHEGKKQAASLGVEATDPQLAVFILRLRGHPLWIPCLEARTASGGCGSPRLPGRRPHRKQDSPARESAVMMRLIMIKRNFTALSKPHQELSGVSTSRYQSSRKRPQPERLSLPFLPRTGDFSCPISSADANRLSRGARRHSSPGHPQDDRSDPQRGLEEGRVGQDARRI